ncbi:MAG: hypothetical protein UR31_C0031G0005 [Parcubacteria group bacterium GW2011_GWA2_33_14]|nr:MAG: hypothetical protein UR31_C0031G0005 [Parcubacteria group bacterium GW2011_GWA2_33_14]OGZ70790.1 MAG: hypothetical protein A2980_02045 [Candidatus Staskawiczbacteria bacterium RIFCSPLOWO2_01_FULL_33_13]
MTENNTNEKEHGDDLNYPDDILRGNEWLLEARLWDANTGEYSWSKAPDKYTPDFLRKGLNLGMTYIEILKKLLMGIEAKEETKYSLMTLENIGGEYNEKIYLLNQFKNSLMKRLGEENFEKLIINLKEETKKYGLNTEYIVKHLQKIELEIKGELDRKKEAFERIQRGFEKKHKWELEKERHRQEELKQGELLETKIDMSARRKSKK